MKEVTETQLAYFAGVFDGEGSITIVRIDRAGKYGRPNATPIYNLRCSVGMQNLSLIKLFYDIFGGSIHYRHQSVYRWIILTNEAESFLRKIQPYIIVKRRQVELALDFVDYVHSRPRTARKSKEECDLYEGIRLKMQELNKEDSILFHEKSGELLGTPSRDNQQPSSSNGEGVEEKVHRLTGEEPTNNPDTSARPERDDIVGTA